jgi:hypothetical protein
VDDPDGAFAALERARATQPMLDRWSEAVRAGEEISRLSQLRRRSAAEIATHRRCLATVDRAVGNIRVALRRIVAAVEDDVLTGGPPSLPAALFDRLEELAGAITTLPGALLDPDGEGGRRTLNALTTLAGRLDPEHLGARSRSATVVVAQLRSAVVDLLQVPGMSFGEARDLFRRP